MFRSILLILVMVLVPATTSAQWPAPNLVRALGVEVLEGPYTILYSPGQDAYAEAVASDLEPVYRFLEDEFGIHTAYTIALLDQTDWETLRSQTHNAFGPFGGIRNFFDLGLLSAPLESSQPFARNHELMTGLSTDAHAIFEGETGLDPVDACSCVGRHTWTAMFAHLARYRFFGNRFTETYGWLGQLTASYMEVAMGRGAWPEDQYALERMSLMRLIPAIDDLEPNIIDFEFHAAEWAQNDMDRLMLHMDWFRDIAARIHDTYGLEFAFALRARMPDGPFTTQQALDTLGTLVPWLPEQLLGKFIGTDRVPGELPSDVTLSPPWPNPFNPSTTLEYALPAAGTVSLSVFDLTGREVRRLDDGFRAAGRYRVTLDATGLPSGLYLCRLVAGGVTRTQALSLLR